jgi:hypothetical protein
MYLLALYDKGAASLATNHRDRRRGLLDSVEDPQALKAQLLVCRLAGSPQAKLVAGVDRGVIVDQMSPYAVAGCLLLANRQPSEVIERLRLEDRPPTHPGLL